MARFSRIMMGLAVGGMTGIAGLALAQAPATNQATDVENDETKPMFRVSGGAIQQFDTGLDRGGTFNMTRLATGLAFRYPISDSITLTHGLGYEYDAYHFSRKTGEPWNDTNLIGYSMVFGIGLSREFDLFVGPMAGFAAESGADWGNALQYGGSAGFHWKPSRDLSLGTGLAVVKPIEQDVRVVPFLLVDWKITPELALRNSRSIPALRSGAGMELAWRFVPKWEVAAGAVYQRRRFRLNEDGPVPDGIGQNTSLPAYVSLNWRPDDSWTLGLNAGVIFGGELRLDNSGGHEISKTNYDAAPFVGAGVSWRK